MSDPTFAVSDAVLDDLQVRLQNTRLPSAVAGQGWARGTDLDYLSQLVDYWQTGFDWRAQEAALGRLTHERVPVSGLVLHQIHERAADPRALPSSVAENLATRHADRVIALHLTDVPYTHLFSLDPAQLSAPERAYLAAGQAWQMSEGAYALIQSTMPTTALAQECSRC